MAALKNAREFQPSANLRDLLRKSRINGVSLTSPRKAIEEMGFDFGLEMRLMEAEM